MPYGKSATRSIERDVKNPLTKYKPIYHPFLDSAQRDDGFYTHIAWLNNRKGDANTYIYICENNTRCLAIASDSFTICSNTHIQ